MNAILDAKKTLANAWINDRTLPSDWRKARAEAARDWLAENGAPHARDHYWSYTKPALLESKIGTAQGQSYRFDGIEILPTSTIDQAGVKVSPIAEAENDLYGRLVANAQGRGARPLAELVLMNAEGLFIEVTGDGGTLTLNRDQWPDAFYLGIRLAKGASLTLIETGANPAKRTSLIEAELADEAAFHHLRVAQSQSEVYHGHLFATLGKKSDLRSFTISGANALNRFESIVDLEGDYGHVSIAGADLLMGKGHQDDTVYITHNAEHCTSRQVFKRVVGAGATSVFQGKILVNEGAQKTDGYQISQGLMLDDGGEVLSKPELEIYADDVVCSHGSTTSGLDDISLFYLRSRGIPMEKARKLLIRAFIEEALVEIDDEALQERMGKIAEAWIFGETL